MRFSNFYIIYLLLFASFRLTAQEIDTNISLINQLKVDSNFYQQLNKLKKDENLFLQNDTIAVQYCLTMSVFYSLIGNYKSSNAMMNKFKEISDYFIGLRRISTLGIRDYKPVILSEYLNKISNSQIIIFNESHHTPQNRITIIENLELFYKKGFRYIAIESLRASDNEQLNKRGFGLVNSGRYYTIEPAYGDLIRKALTIGFTIVGYDIGADDSKKQAEFVFDKILKNNSKSKMLVLCSYSHGLSISDILFGYHLEKITQVKPFVFEQYQLTDMGDTLLNRKDYQYVITNYAPQKPIVLLNKNNQLWRSGSTDGSGAVFIPPSQFYKNRPTWLLHSNRKFVSINLDKQIDKFPVLVQAYSANEGDQSIPVDQVEIKSADECYLSLYLGDYILIFRNQNGNEILRKKYQLK